MLAGARRVVPPTLAFTQPRCLSTDGPPPATIDITTVILVLTWAIPAILVLVSMYQTLGGTNTTQETETTDEDPVNSNDVSLDSIPD